MKMLMIFIHLWKSFFVLFCFIFFFKNDNVEEGTVFFYCNFPHYLLLVSPTPP